MAEPVVRVIATGGTIDEDHADPVTGKSLFAETRVPQMLAEASVLDGVVLETLFMKDSSDITEEDRKKILERCLSCPEKEIVVVHGTNTMAETATVLGSVIADKTVVLVGAFVPYVKKGSDAVQNLHYAVAQARQLPPGVYIAMHGQTFPWNNVRKNKEKQVFENLEKTVE